MSAKGKKGGILRSGKSPLASKPMDMEFLIILMIIVLFGLIMVGSASSVTALYRQGDSLYFLKKQLLMAVVGVVLMLIVSRIDYHFLCSSQILVMAAGVVWIMLFIPLFSAEDINGAKRWINLGGMSFQPSELAKIVWILLFAKVCSSQTKEALNNFKTSWLTYGIMLGIVLFPLILQPHKSAMILITAVCGLIVIIAGANLKYLLPVGIAGAGGFTLLILFSDYSRARITSFLDPFSDPTGDGWQVIQSMYAIGSGGLLGKGLGQSVQKALYIPEPHNDFIFAVICEELGFLGALFVIVLFFLLIMRCVKIAMDAPDKLGTLIGIGIAALIFVQVFINICVVTSMFPVTGMPLPFFSAGGTNLLFTIASMGILLNISRQKKDKPTQNSR
ncbi:MAG: putative lipid II flippase FtsW [Clostridia bacterium]|nr:putative lipid II flippase FtsW [Clostridia bacterium]